MISTIVNWFEDNIGGALIVLFIGVLLNDFRLIGKRDKERFWREAMSPRRLDTAMGENVETTPDAPRRRDRFEGIEL